MNHAEPSQALTLPSSSHHASFAPSPTSPRLAVVGATGSLGRVIVSRALARGHEVVAISRDPSRIASEHPGHERALVRRACDVTDATATAQALAGADAVIVALGAGILDRSRSRELGTRGVLAGMKQLGLRRLVCLSILGLGDSYATLPWGYKLFVKPLLLRLPYRDHAAQEALVGASDLDWTLVRPPNFTDGPATGDHRHGVGDELQHSTLRISRADLADFMIDQVSDDRYLRAAPAISYVA